MSIFDLKLGFKCNNNCVHCVVADKRSYENLTLEEIFNTISKVEKGSYLQITGGEPTLFKEELPIILKFAKERGLLPTIQTNGTGFADKTFIAKCAPYVHNWHIAIHSCNPQIHDRIVQSKGMWEKTIEGFKNAIEYKNVILTTQTVVSTYNIETLYETFQMIQKMAPGTQMSLTYPHLNGNAYKNRETLAFRYSEYQDILYRCLRDFEPYLFTESIPPCHLYPYINHPSLEEDILNNYEERIGLDISQGKNLQNYNYSDVKERRKAPRCKECLFNNKCIGVWKEYIETFKNKLDLIPLTKERMEKLYESSRAAKN